MIKVKIKKKMEDEFSKTLVSDIMQDKPFIEAGLPGDEIIISTILYGTAPEWLNRDLADDSLVLRVYPNGVSYVSSVSRNKTMNIKYVDVTMEVRI